MFSFFWPINLLSILKQAQQQVQQNNKPASVSQGGLDKRGRQTVLFRRGRVQKQRSTLIGRCRHVFGAVPEKGFPLGIITSNKGRQQTS